MVGDEIAFGGQANGGFSKVYLALAINSSCQHPKEAAILVNFLLNEDMGASIMGTACGLPDSVTGRAAATAAGLVNPLVVEANNRMMAFVDFPLDPTFESPPPAACYPIVLAISRPFFAVPKNERLPQCGQTFHSLFFTQSTPPQELSSC